MYVGLPYCRAEMYTGRVACCPLVIHGISTGRKAWLTDGRTSDSYIMLSAKCDQCKKSKVASVLKTCLIHSPVSKEHRLVTDRQTDRQQTDRHRMLRYAYVLHMRHSVKIASSHIKVLLEMLQKILDSLLPAIRRELSVYRSGVGGRSSLIRHLSTTFLMLCCQLQKPGLATCRRILTHFIQSSKNGERNWGIRCQAG